MTNQIVRDKLLSKSVRRELTFMLSEVLVR